MGNMIFSKYTQRTLFLFKKFILHRFLYFYTEINKKSYQAWRENIFSLLAVAEVIIILIVIIPAVIIYFKNGLYLIGILDICAFLANLFIAVFSKIKFSIKYFLSMLTFYLIGTFLLILKGPVGSGFLWLMCFALMSILDFDFKQSIINFFINMTTFLIIGILRYNSLIHWKPDDTIIFENYIISSLSFLTINIFFGFLLFFYINSLKKSYSQITRSRSAAILGLAKLVEYRDKETSHHLERIREYALLLCKLLGKLPKYKNYITQDYMDDLYISSILHDIGKVGIPDYILLKPDKLTNEEFMIMKNHCIVGGDVLKEISEKTKDRTFLSLGKDIAYYHHEKWNGSGYPKGLKGEEIPLSARIVAIVDVYDALTSARPYKPAFSHEKSIEIIKEESNKHFDPEITAIFLEQEKEFNMIRLQYQ